MQTRTYYLLLRERSKLCFNRFLTVLSLDLNRHSALYLSEVKRTLHISLSILLSALVLLSGSGIVFGKMVCAGDDCCAVVDYKAVEDCCGGDEHEQQAQTRFECCDILNIDLSTDNYFGTQFVFDASQLATFEVPHYFSFESIPLVNETVDIPPSDQSPPGGRSLLHRTHLLLI